MIRYKKKLQVSTSNNGDIRIDTDMGQSWRATTVKGQNQFTQWLQAHHTALREWQRDMLQIIHQAYNPQTDLNPIYLHWVYQKGQGYQNQSVDIAFATIPDKNIYVLMTPANTWIHQTKYGNFDLVVDDASGPVTDELTQDEIWNFRDIMIHGRVLSPNKKYSDNDYVNKGVAPNA